MESFLDDEVESWSFPHPTHIMADFFFPRMIMDPTIPLSPIKATVLPLGFGSSKFCNVDVGNATAKGIADIPGVSSGRTDDGGDDDDVGEPVLASALDWGSGRELMITNDVADGLC